MSTTPRTYSCSTSFTDIGTVIALTFEDARALSRLAGWSRLDPRIEQFQDDTTLMACHNLIDRINFQLYLGREIVHEYRYTVQDDMLEEYGPAAGSPPIWAVPPGTAFRITVTPNPHADPVKRARIFARLGWGEVEVLDHPVDAQFTVFGAFASGGYAVERSVYSNPKYNRAAAAGDVGHREEAYR